MYFALTINNIQGITPNIFSVNLFLYTSKGTFSMVRLTVMLFFYYWNLYSLRLMIDILFHKKNVARAISLNAFDNSWQSFSKFATFC